MPQAGSGGPVVYIQTTNPANLAQPGDFWWDGTTFRVRLGSGAGTANPLWRDITTAVGTA